MSANTDKDLEQDMLIRQNAEHIRRNEESIARQTACLEKIRDHYFPRKSVWKRTCGFFLKVIGAVTVGAGLMETFDWYWNTRQIENLAEQSVAVAQRLMFEESDLASAVAFLERAVELDENKAKYRMMLAYVKGLVAIGNLVDVERPLTQDERERIDAILAEAVFLQASAPDDPMPHVLTAQAYMLRQEFALAGRAVAKAVSINPNNVHVRCNACAIHFFAREFDLALAELEAAAKLRPDYPLVTYWRGMLAATIDRDFAKAREWFEKMVRTSPRVALPHAMLGWTILNGPNPDVAAGRSELARAVEINPRLKIAMLRLGESYLVENPIVARLWFDRALACDRNYMKALMARARVNVKLGERKAAIADFTAALALDPFRADLLRERAAEHEALGDAAAAAADRRTADALAGR